MILHDIITFLIGFVSSMAALIVWFHFDLEARWQHRKAEHGRKLEERLKQEAKHLTH